mmetsp:Transcript_74003/g.171679  ORF Transcript_74003/g.171679 Transcript_74003/m.171679 type:complete len:408 (+) Transcript_74003:179-1402(+)|eukprot:CAMPEP_0171085340 /NCGR_PEP_ID=MMETSP0766_2-20121228/18877_1 /TAXON_ID=439317 /ORGANISM="Gambierdiscus australes, Strain CAWD 149" /LENGTH=407 /DNA_ID=CAMNT_0011542903 /DNA_START=98 /DNA_END=1321 /DNA_ORIENTATION=+
MGCSCAASQASTPRVAKVEVAEVSELPDTPRTGVEEESGLSPRPKLLRKWSQNSLESESSLLSLERRAAGHGGNSILKYVDKHAPEVPEIPEFVMKVWDDTEACFYKELIATGDSLLPFVPTFHGEVDPEDLPADLEGGSYMRLSNVLRRCSANPNVMDCKLGIRSFEESEVQSPKLREDLYKKLVELDPAAPTRQEHEAGAVTKYRWMSANDAWTSLQSHGFRIDGLENCNGKVSKKRLRELRSLSDVASIIVEELMLSGQGASCRSKTGTGMVSPASAPRDMRLASAAAKSVLWQLCRMREAMMVSELVRSHSFVGTSLLFVVDARGPTAGVALIDFAHTVPLPEGVSVDHRRPWEVGNHEDGILFGMDNMIQCWEMVLKRLAGEEGSSLAVKSTEPLMWCCATE